MSRSVRDLVEAIQPDEDHLFDSEAIWQRSLRRARQRTVQRRTTIAVAAIAAVAAIVAPSVILLPRSSGPGPNLPGESGSPSVTATPSPSIPPTSTRPALSATLRPLSGDDWVIMPARTDASLQLAYVRRADETKQMGSIEVYEPGAFDPAAIMAGTSTTVDGAPAYFDWLPDPFHTAREVRRSLAWQYAPDAWVVVRIEHDTPTPNMTSDIPDELYEIASGIEIGDPEPVRLPFRVGFRPDTMIPAFVNHFDGAWLNRQVYYDYVSSPSGSLDREREFNLPLHIGMNPAVPDQWQPDITVGGQPAMRNGTNEVIIAIGDQWLTIGSGLYTGPLSTEEIEQIFAGLTFADWNDQSTWFDANTAA